MRNSMNIEMAFRIADFLLFTFYFLLTNNQISNY